jgi:hypothetical protein
MHVCIYMRMYVYACRNVHVFICMQACMMFNLQSLRAVYLCMYMRVYVSMYLVRAYVFVPFQNLLHFEICMYVCMYVCMSNHMYVYYICIHITSA